MKFGFIGGTERGYRLFEELLRNDLRAEFCIILKEDDHERVRFSEELEKLTRINGIRSSVKKKLTSPDYEVIRQASIDFIIVCGWRTLINTEVNSFLKIGLLAAHDSLLPKYRGFAPLNWVIINGERETGVTIFRINDGEVDSGDVAIQKHVVIGPDDSVNEINEKLICATIDGYLEIITRYKEQGEMDFTPQNDNGATYTCKRTPEDGKIFWDKSSLEVYNLVRALYFPYSGAFFYYENNKYEVRRAKLGPQNSKKFIGNIPGRIIYSGENGIEVLCGSGSIMLEEIFDYKSNQVVPANLLFKSIAMRLN